MRSYTRASILPTSLLTFLFGTAALASSVVDFSSYPTAAQSCLYQASNSSGCSGSTVLAMDTCLCGNGGNFVTQAAACIGEKDAGDAVDVYDTLNTVCSGLGLSLNVPEAVFLSSASTSLGTNTRSTTSTKTTSSSATTATSTLATSTQTSTSTGSSAIATPTGSASGTDGSADGGSSGLSKRATAGIISGTVIAGVAILIAVVYLCMRYRRKKYGEETRPMLQRKGRVGSDFSVLPNLKDIRALQRPPSMTSSQAEEQQQQQQQQTWRHDLKGVGTPSSTAPPSPPMATIIVTGPGPGPDVDRDARGNVRESVFNWESPYQTMWADCRPASQPSQHWIEPPGTPRSERSLETSPASSVAMVPASALFSHPAVSPGGTYQPAAAPKWRKS